MSGLKYHNLYTCIKARICYICFSCGPEGNVLITEIGLPLNYDDVNFKFNNLGAFANTVVNGVGMYFLKSQEDMMISEIRKVIRKEVNSLIC
jgi:hypothetical protein